MKKLALLFAAFLFSTAYFPVVLSGRDFESSLSLNPFVHEDVRSKAEESSNRLVERPMNLIPLLAEGEERPDINHKAGYFRLNRTHDARMFYFFFESRGDKSTAPLVLWMTGGPGCSSEIALFFENGPFKIKEDKKSLSWNPYGWDLVSNIIYVDQPVNTGFSYSHDPRDMRHSEKGVAEDMADFLQAFMEAHPDYANRPFFVTGESYGGHYIPAVAARVNEGNKAGEGRRINLQGFAIGNGLTQPLIQYASYPDFAFEEGLISESEFQQLRHKFWACGMAIRACGTEGHVSCAAAFIVCGEYWTEVYGRSGDGNLNVYDIRGDCEVQPLCYDMSAADVYLAQPKVRAALGVGNRPWVSCNMRVYRAMMIDFMRDLEPKVPGLLEDGVRGLIYAGDKDFICNWLGNSRWVGAMEWSGHDEYAKAPWRPFLIDGTAVGNTTGAGPLSFLRVFDAGHMVPMDQPAVALEMLRRFVNNLPLGAEREAFLHRQPPQHDQQQPHKYAVREEHLSESGVVVLPGGLEFAADDFARSSE